MKNHRALILLVLLAVALLPFPTAGQTALEIQVDELIHTFPTGLAYHLKAEAQSEIQRIYLRYGAESQSCQAGSARQSILFNPSRSIDVRWDWEYKRSGTLPPGARVWWQWELIDEQGSSILTEIQYGEVADQRHTWNRLSASGIHLQWYSGPHSTGQSLLNIAQRSLARLEKEMGIRPSEEIWITIYPTFEEVKDAIVFSPEWTGGAAFSEYGGVIIGVPPASQSWAESVIPHELAHLVVGQLVFNCRGVSLPTWLSEGLAVFAEGPVSKGSRDEVIAALEKNRLPSLKSLESGFSAYGDAAGLSYQQSGLVVQYLYREQGVSRLLELLSVMQSGLRIDPALQQVYGMDTHGLDAAWRASLGYQAPETSASPTRRILPTNTRVPTLALFTSAVQPSLTPTSLPATDASPPVPTHTLTPAPTRRTSLPVEASPASPSAAAPASDPAGSAPAPGLSGWLLIGLGGSAFLLFALLMTAKHVRRKRE